MSYDIGIHSTVVRRFDSCRDGRRIHCPFACTFVDVEIIVCGRIHTCPTACLNGNSIGANRVDFPHVMRNAAFRADRSFDLCNVGL